MIVLTDSHYPPGSAHPCHHTQCLTEQTARKQAITGTGGLPDNRCARPRCRPLQSPDKHHPVPLPVKKCEGNTGDNLTIKTQYQHQLPLAVKATGRTTDIQPPAVLPFGADKRCFPADVQHSPDLLRKTPDKMIMVKNCLYPESGATVPEEIGTVNLGR
ncbi:hypothetical protein BvCms2454_04407 [Escherichia coli]|nr:hypothetical protein BvCms2454_04407 [Escherichia coli]GDV07256.1 hypothetical protein BvCmsSINP049_02512 [Escherichia coli]